MEIIILIIVIVATYNIGYINGLNESETILQDVLNELIEDAKRMEAYKTGRGRWEKQENEQNIDDGLRKKKKN